MADSNEKKSLDEILSDLNRILSRMPDLADTLKTPEIKPIDFSSIVEEKLRPVEEIKIENDTEVKSEVPAERLNTEIQSSESGNTPAENKEDQVYSSLDSNVSKPENENAGNACRNDVQAEGSKVLESTNDFGAPDIDFLFGMASESDGRKDLETAPQALPSDLAAYKPEEKTGGEMEENREEKKEEPIQPPQEINDSSQNSGEADLGNNAPSENTLGSDENSLVLDIEKLSQAGDDLQQIPQPQNQEPATVEDSGEKTVKIDLSEIVLDQGADAQPSESLVKEKEVKSESDPNLSLEIGALESVAENKSDLDSELEKLTLETPLQPNSGETEFKAETADTRQETEEKTVIFDPQIKEDMQVQEEEKTVVFSPSETNRIPKENQDFTSLQAPESVPAERVKNVGFIVMDRNMLNHVLRNIDEICLASQSKPMFVNRAFILDYSEDTNANLINQKAAENSCLAVVAVGEFPHERVYELETVFSSGNTLFRNFKPSEFSRAQAIDFVLDLIAK
ncbi:MAG: hypothetical protein Fur0012_09630 [Elusimicrobiota bacterium]